MQNIQTFSQARKLLAGYAAQPKQVKYNLDLMQSLMRTLGNPQDKYQVIHIAGTSGKTSTAYYIASLLQKSAKKIGLTVSPHVDEINERLQINLVPLPEEQFCSEISEFIKIVEEHNLQPSYFEIMVAFAYWEFARQKVDYAVVEVGLGGLLDGTNVVNDENKVCVITDIDLDHTEVLGKTVPEIAAQKAGIIQKGNAVFSYQQPGEIMGAIKERCITKHAHLVEVEPKELRLSSNLPIFQRHNWYLANQVFNFVAERDQLQALTDTKLAQTKQTYIPARMEVIAYGAKTVIIDGSHNAQKIKTLATSIQDQFHDKQIAVLVSFVDSPPDRTKAAIKEITGIAQRIIITSFSGEQDSPKYSVDPQQVAKFCEELGFINFSVVEDPKQAFEELLKQHEPILLVTGSFYLLNHIRPLLSSKDVIL